MKDVRPPANSETSRRRKRRERAKRALIAGYIHGLSERHGSDRQPRDLPLPLCAERP
jgi:hypothetical protein